MKAAVLRAGECDSRWSGLAAVVVGHLALGAGLLQVDRARQPVAEAAPLFVDFIAPPQAAVELPAAQPPRVVPPKRDLTPLLTAARPTPAPVEFLVPPSLPPEPAVMAGIDGPPSAPPAPPAAPTPKVVMRVEYLRPPQLEYPVASRRLNEQGKVLLRVLIGRNGVAEQVEVLSSSGSRRLDEAAVKAAREALYRPYAENGEPVPVWALVRAVFELSE